MLTKKEQRLRRARQTRIRIATQGVARLTVNRTNLHIYASVISGDGGKVIASASTAEAEVRTALGAAGKGGNVAAAQIIGKRVAEKAKAAGVEKVAGSQMAVDVADLSFPLWVNTHHLDPARKAALGRECVTIKTRGDFEMSVRQRSLMGVIKVHRIVNALGNRISSLMNLRFAQQQVRRRAVDQCAEPCGEAAPQNQRRTDSAHPGDQNQKILRS